MSRKQECLDAAAKLAAKHGAVNISRVMVAEKVGVSSVLVGRYIGQKGDRVRNIKSAMRKLGLTEPDKAKIETEGVKLRAHGPRKTTKAQAAKGRALTKVVKAELNKAGAAKKSSVKRTSAKTAAAEKTVVPGGHAKAVGPTSNPVSLPSPRVRRIKEVKAIKDKVGAVKKASSKTSTSPISSDQKSVGDAPSNKAIPAAPVNKARTPRKPPTNTVVLVPAA